MPATNTNPLAFECGNARVYAVEPVDKKGNTVICIETRMEYLRVYVTKSGSVRIISLDDEWVRK